MKYDDFFGVSAEEEGWVPSPSYMLRRHRILKQLKRMPHGELMEIGCGAGAFLYDARLSGFACGALESSEKAVCLASSINFPDVKFYRSPAKGWGGKFDLVCAFEVMEHIEDDEAALQLWQSWLKPDGYVLLSVPAHRKKWSSSDVWAGHVRRYEKKELIDRLNGAGLIVEEFECYGFPLANMLDPLRSYIHKRAIKRRASEGVSGRQGHNDLSGIERPAERKLYPLMQSFLGKALMRLAFWLQDLTVSKEWGNGYFVVARKVRN